MEITIRQGEEFIRLGQALKKAGIVGSGLDAKMIILEESVQVNGATETRRGRKLYPGDTVSYKDTSFQVVKCS